jgi:hypothetical protein
VGGVGPKLPLRAHSGQRREHTLAPADPTWCHGQRAGGGPSGYGGWVDTGWVIKNYVFGRNAPQIAISIVVPLFCHHTT